jgi:phage/plasmid-like protein (TIGR03299 family)
MAHELDMTRGQAAIAFRGATPWHNLGNEILPQDDIDTIRIKAGIDYDVIKTPVRYEREVIPPPGMDPRPAGILEKSTNACVLYRSDTGDDLSVVSNQYQVVQPKAVIEFYRDLTEKFGFQLEVVGALKGGRKVWALANTGNAVQLRDRDDVKGYLLLATSYDGSMATQARFTSVRVVCNNTLGMAIAGGAPEVSVPHSTKFDADKVKEQLRIGEAWERFAGRIDTMTRRIVKQDEVVQLLMAAYYNLATPQAIAEFHQDEKQAANAKKTMDRLTEALFNSPGANLASARGTLWGALNAVTFDVDHKLPSRTDDSRLDKAWFGLGNTIKQRAFAYAEKLVA